MNGGDKILDRIKADSKASVDAIINEATKNCRQIREEAEKAADKRAAAIKEKAVQKTAQINASAKSRSELATRNALLKTRRIEIDKTVEGLKDYLLNLGDNEYFEALYRLAAQLSGKSGELLLNKKDLSRLPHDFEGRIRACGLDAGVSQTPADISGGFVLKNGDIEENMDFAALISSRRDEIEDLINRELFAQ